LLFSETAGIQAGGSEWFDPFLNLDTPLFVDPFLLFDAEKDEFLGAHEELVRYFQIIFERAAESGGDRNSQSWKKAVSLSTFPEVPYLCIGYSAADTRGLGSGPKTAARIVQGLWKAIAAGIKEIKHFEEVQIFEEGVGPDRISDAAACILLHRFAKYTERIARAMNVPVREAPFGRFKYDFELGRWTSGTAMLPWNAYRNHPILLVPKRYLRSLPSMNVNGFWDFAWDHDNELIRREFGEEITKRVKKERIIELALRHPAVRDAYIRYLEANPPQGYNFVRDERGIINWYPATRAHFEANSIQLALGSSAELQTAVMRMAEEFRHFVEQGAGWRLLWNDDGSPRREEASQLACYGIFSHYCRANNIDITREADVGRGPVDFKFAQGHSIRTLLEVKLAKNSKFWHGLQRQLPAYMTAERATHGIFLVVVLNDKDAARITDIQKDCAAVAQQTGFDIKTLVVDARRQQSASRV